MTPCLHHSRALRGLWLATAAASTSTRHLLLGSLWQSRFWPGAHLSLFLQRLKVQHPPSWTHYHNLFWILAKPKLFGTWLGPPGINYTSSTTHLPSLFSSKAPSPYPLFNFSSYIFHASPQELGCRPPRIPIATLPDHKLLLQRSSPALLAYNRKNFESARHPLLSLANLATTPQYHSNFPSFPQEISWDLFSQQAFPSFQLSTACGPALSALLGEPHRLSL
ncbi:hypothetical protein LMH87_007193 [Akanthomyces muscarius]|uniref:Uncharacterized protein n=1 Tax=Akanthomyces muscarius TaxID=2231603 RepID=A0A9W8UTJ1_AKAMU|nr:hypothetical protein LMH87_007193 [Akanthomyces muscarius]KAJ4165565.1 hypothetical protein LMH87_007193 [Akanthomyces muscarius]